MLNLEAQVIRIHNFELGGKTGERPTALIGSIFYRNHRIVRDPEKGDFDTRRAKELLDREAEISAQTGNPRILDIIAETPEAMIKYIAFILEHSDAPFLVDSSLARVREAGMRFAAREGALERAIYNSIEPQSNTAELDLLEEIGVKHAVILACGSQYIRPNDRLKLLLGNDGKTGLIQKVKEKGVQNILIDPGVLDLPSSGWTAKAIQLAKQQIGLVCGCAPANALYSWLRQRRYKSPELEACGAAVLAMPLFAGADFLFYGPIENANWVYPSVGVMNAMTAYAAKLEGVKPTGQNHPLKRLFTG
jgi:tetrahydromethanopterin S-methyltransferase subunit H